MTPARRDRIGPNAILQLLPVIDRQDGPEGTRRMLAAAGLAGTPDGTRMIPETEAAGLHRALRRLMPRQAAGMAAEAGRGTADYILAHRIPKPAQMLLKALPAPLSARLLARAIAGHAWTFAGTGEFRVVDPWTFEIRDNPLIRGETAATPLCAWNAAVFGHLYATLVDRTCRCVETDCAAASGSHICRFRIRRGQ
ncbi:bacteriochlorophyll 4-vinyl reductase [Prosthecodimorpha staleyi]|uniref:Bacteriochlorophyll 4-vinyl reductase n=1 Tax=Prosthecodimorpha staleyi TaxID=2840188 RepID=A0A947D2L9_9HYPH|nr:bacteriochlorophyll 4-vinyl reductase [Prosthecodimorpha staleyi]MBT9289828.1 bacteriochlorophyll 4-vinyl reductase [Prosthecodimorpha staleyi]